MPLSAWSWTATLRSTQYLFIVVVLRVREQMAVAPTKPNPLHHPALVPVVSTACHEL